MPESFDPYRVWLSIPRESRPPTHYQFLGISPDERDPTVINAAVMRQSAYVRNFQVGKYAEEAARILNEIQAAKACLLDSVTRARYDAKITQQYTVAAHQPESPSPAPLTPIIDIDLLAYAEAQPTNSAAVPRNRPAIPSGLSKPKRPKRLRTSWAVAVIGFAALTALIAVTVWPTSDEQSPLVNNSDPRVIGVELSDTSAVSVAPPPEPNEESPEPSPPLTDASPESAAAVAPTAAAPIAQGPRAGV